MAGLQALQVVLEAPLRDVRSELRVLQSGIIALATLEFILGMAEMLPKNGEQQESL